MASLRNQLDIERRKVDVDYSDITIRELHRMLDQEEINSAPAYQRKFRWTEAAESRLIESILLGLPVPSLFVATNQDFTWEVVDGLQRLSSIAHFVGESDRLLSQIDKKAPLRLKELGTLTELDGKTYDDLEDDVKLYFMRRTLRVTALSDKSDLQVRFDLFERLNGGAVSLTPQEVRACIYRGAFTLRATTRISRQIFRMPNFGPVAVSSLIFWLATNRVASLRSTTTCFSIGR